MKNLAAILIEHARGFVSPEDLLTLYTALEAEGAAVSAMPLNDKTLTKDELRTLIGDGREVTTRQRIETIKQHRERTGCGLKESKDIIDAYTDLLNVIVRERNHCVDMMTPEEIKVLVVEDDPHLAATMVNNRLACGFEQADFIVSSYHGKLEGH